MFEAKGMLFVFGFVAAADGRGDAVPVAGGWLFGKRQGRVESDPARKSWMAIGLERQAKQGKNAGHL